MANRQNDRRRGAATGTRSPCLWPQHRPTDCAQQPRTTAVGPATPRPYGPRRRRRAFVVGTPWRDDIITATGAIARARDRVARTTAVRTSTRGTYLYCTYGVRTKNLSTQVLSVPAAQTHTILDSMVRACVHVRYYNSTSTVLVHVLVGSYDRCIANIFMIGPSVPLDSAFLWTRWSLQASQVLLTKRRYICFEKCCYCTAYYWLAS